jgi:hypothetical protein
VLGPYIKQNMKFFVARVNLKEHEKSGDTFLPPLQFSFASEKFMLPIRLGMINARGPQDLVLWVLTKNGRVESTNYRTVKLPANINVPPYIKADKEQGIRPVLQGALRRAGEARRLSRGVHRVLLGHELVRSVRRGSLERAGTEEPRRAMGRRRHAPGRARDGDAPSRALHAGHVPGRSRVPGNRRPAELPDALRAAASGADRARGVSRRRRRT